MVRPIKTWPLLVGAIGLFLALPDLARPAPEREPINTLQDMRRALSACWAVPADTQDFKVTVSFSFKRNGDVLGKPRITHTRFNGDIEEQKLILASILQALDDCTPLNITPALGRAVAGRIFTMIFAPPSYRS